MECEVCGEETPFRKMCAECGSCPECCECEGDEYGFDSDEMGEEPEDEWLRRTR